tara:strand:+ start:371 stop:484 length:114 start_codon:yes stop_codon:yes gene_type:complete
VIDAGMTLVQAAEFAQLKPFDIEHTFDAVKVNSQELN